MTAAPDSASRRLKTLTECLRGRRTIALFQDRPVDESIVRAAIDVARWAPNHHVSQPWHFYLLGKRARAELVQLNGQVVTERRGAQIGARKIRQWARVPGWLLVTCATSDNELRQLEDYAACCCAVQNMALYLWQAGVGMKWSTGPVTRDPRLYEMLGIDPGNEILVGLVSHGYPRSVPKQKRRPLDEIFTRIE